MSLSESTYSIEKQSDEIVIFAISKNNKIKSLNILIVYQAGVQLQVIGKKRAMTYKSEKE